MADRNAELQEAIATLDMEAWMDDEGVRYKSARGASGRQLNVKECPCCGNSNWKVFINAETGLGNCFSGDCEEKFNKWKFVKAYLGMENYAAVQHIKAAAAKQGWRPPKLTSAPVEMDHTALKLPESFPMPHHGKNLKYLDNRGITAEIARYFNLRFSLKGKFFYRDEGRWKCQDYSQRVIVPVFDLDGQLVSFQGRDITGTADRKYLFPPGFSSTGTILYNGHNAKGARRITLGEGAFDVAAIKIAFDQEMDLRDVVPVGTFGKHLSFGDDSSQLAKLMQLKELGLREVTFMWDGEEQAYRDAVKAALQVHSIGLVARVARLPDDKDPNEVPPEVVRQAFYQARVVTPTTAIRLKLQPMQFVGSLRISQ